MTDEHTATAALLHDMVEDTHYTIENLAHMGYPEAVLGVVELVTNDGSKDYLDYIREIKSKPIALAVKLADLKHNSDLSRLNAIDGNALWRNELYKKALAVLQEDN